jgi:acetyltransferase-like isoleucine patch superfamily enzyme
MKNHKLRAKDLNRAVRKMPMFPEPFIDSSANLSPQVKIWAGTQIRENALIGEGTSIGQYCYIGPGVIIGKNCSIQNQALIYEPTVIHDGVFIGPGVVVTNDLNPRAMNSRGSRKSEKDWSASAAEILDGASLGAGVICVGPVRIGEWALVAAGAVVTRDVGNYELVAGIPARKIGWVGQAGFRLKEISPKAFVCPSSGQSYVLDQLGHMSPAER